MISKILSGIDKQKITIGGWLAGFAGIVFIRFILENFSSPSALGFLVSDPDTLVQYAFFFILSALGLATILYFFDNKNKNTIKYALFGLPIIWLAPILDIILSKGKGSYMVYVADSHTSLIYDFLTFFNVQNATVGIKIEIFVLLFGIGFYIWQKYKNIKKTILTVLLSYSFLFILGTMPGLLFTITNPINPTTNTAGYIEQLVTKSNFTHNSLHPTLVFNSYYRFLEIGFDKLISQIFFILTLLVLFIWFWKTEKQKTISILKNSRPERIGFYWALIGAGMFSAFLQNLGSLSVWIDYMSLFILLISWYTAGMFAVHINDIADTSIDEISNKDRPLIKGDLDKKEMKETGKMWLLISIVGSFIVSPYTLFMNLVFTASYYIYSAPPLRLKRIPIFSSFLISIACLASISAGFFFISQSKEVYLFSRTIAIGIIIMFTLATNVRDLKDIEGDKADGIKTIPTMFGKYGKQITAILFATSFLLLPIVVSIYTLYITAIPAGIIGYKIVMKKKYEEKYIFILYFAFCLLTALTIGGLKYLASNITI